MIKEPYSIYELLAKGVDSKETIQNCCTGELWAGVWTASGFGIAMNTEGSTIKSMYPTLEGLSLQEAARAAASWNFSEASLGLAAVNAYYNTRGRLDALGCEAGPEMRPTDDIDFTGKTVGIIGHMHGCDELWEKSAHVYRLERSPRDGDYPDSACDFFLPKCDIVLITGSSLVNKTLPHLLELCRGALTILTGPSVPMCPQLLDMGIDRISGLVVTQREEMRSMLLSGAHGSPMKNGKMFIIAKR